MHGDSTLEIDDRDHSHGRRGSRMGGVIGLDVGGANTKAVWLHGGERRAVSRPFEVWRDREALERVLGAAVADVAPELPEAVALTPTAELSDAFRISADVLLILGHLTPGAYTGATPDGRRASVDCARERVARLVCADAEQLPADEIHAIAAFLHTEQVRQIEAAARRAGGRLEGPAPVVPLGVGAFLAREAAERLGRAVVELPWSAAERDAAPAAALAELLADRLRPPCC